MTTTELYKALAAAASLVDLESVLDSFRLSVNTKWRPLGRENNRGTIELSADPARSAVERITNGIDAVIEAEHQRHGGVPECRSPREAAASWLGIPDQGLSAMTPTERRSLAQRVTIALEPGDGRESRIVQVRDRGIGIAPQDMPSTILSLNESNKLQKHYLAGAYGQGGSTTFSFCRYTLIASRRKDFAVGFTVVRFLDLPPEEYKIGHYVYLVFADGSLAQADLNIQEFPEGTLVRHFGYDLSGYPSPLVQTAFTAALTRPCLTLSCRSGSIIGSTTIAA